MTARLLAPSSSTFVFTELRKRAPWLLEREGLYHYLDRQQGQVDIVLNRPRAPGAVKVYDLLALYRRWFGRAQLGARMDEKYRQLLTHNGSPCR